MPTQRQPRTCFQCRTTTTIWEAWGHSNVACVPCASTIRAEKKQYNEDAQRKRLVRRVCQMCGVTSDDAQICFHHVHRGEGKATVLGICCASCNLFLGKCGDDPREMMRRAMNAMFMNGRDFQENHYDAERDGPFYLPPTHYHCSLCDEVLKRDNRRNHERTIKHGYAYMTDVD